MFRQPACGLFLGNVALFQQAGNFAIEKELMNLVLTGNNV
jgi:hypothetical protein